MNITVELTASKICKGQRSWGMITVKLDYNSLRINLGLYILLNLNVN